MLLRPARAMRLLLALALLLAPLAAARPVCVELGCVAAEDRDGDRAPDWVNVATSVEHALTLNLNLNRTNATYEAAASTEETLDPSHTVVAYGYGAPGNRTVVVVEANEADEETGDVTTLAWAWVAVAPDEDGDGAPEVDRDASFLP